MIDKDKKEEIVDELEKTMEIVDGLEKTEEDREFYRLHSDPLQMEIDQRILGRMAPLSFMGIKEEVNENTESININNIFEVDGMIFAANEEDMEL